MEQRKEYIDKSFLVDEIEKRINEEVESSATNFGYSNGCIDSMRNILSFIDTLDVVEVKEVDLDEVKIGETQIYIEDDGGEPPYDGKQWLDLGCLEYEIPKDKFKDGDNVEVIVRKVQKGD